LQNLNKKIVFKNQEIIKENVLKLIPNFSHIDDLPKKNYQDNKKKEFNFFEEEIKISNIDYYFTNSISRSSKTMSECRSIKLKQLKNGTSN
jgi:hypothetical protein